MSEPKHNVIPFPQQPQSLSPPPPPASLEDALQDPQGGDVLVPQLTLAVANKAVCNPRRNRIIRCGTNNGFCLVISQKDSRAWAIQKRVNGKQTRRTIGRLPLPVSKALMLYKGFLGTVAAGKSITRRAEKVANGPALTLKAAHERYLAAQRLSKGSVSRYSDAYRALDAALGSKGDNFWSLTKAECRATFSKIAEVSSKENATYCFRYFTILWNYHSLEIEAARICPTTVLQKDRANYTPRTGKLTPQTFASWWTTFDSLRIPGRSQGAETVWALYFRTLVLTGCRRTEILNLRWQYIDLEEGVITLPKEITKTKQKHEFPIGPYLKRLLAAHRKTQKESTEFVFAYPADCGAFWEGKRLNVDVDKIVKKHRALSTVKWTPHDLRRTFATVAVEESVPFLVHKKLMNHKVKDQTGEYAQIGLRIMRRHQERIEAAMLKLAGIK